MGKFKMALTKTTNDQGKDSKQNALLFLVHIERKKERDLCKVHVCIPSCGIAKCLS